MKLASPIRAGEYRPEICPALQRRSIWWIKSRSRKAGGIGLGLALCSRIAELHNASLHIESREGEGTRVTVVFRGSLTEAVKELKRLVTVRPGLAYV